MNRPASRSSRSARRQHRRGSVGSEPLPYSSDHWKWFWIGLGAIVFGYISLSVPPVNGFVSMTIAPLLLIAGYCIIVPMALLLREKDKTSD